MYTNCTGLYHIMMQASMQGNIKVVFVVLVNTHYGVVYLSLVTCVNKQG